MLLDEILQRRSRSKVSTEGRVFSALCFFSWFFDILCVKFLTREEAMSSLYNHLSPKEMWGERVYTLPELQYPERLNAYWELLDGNIKAGRAARAAIHFQGQTITYGELHAWVNRLANALKKKGVGPGDRVMLRGWNNPSTVAAWLAIGRLGAVNVATMPLLRVRELTYMSNDAECMAIVCSPDLLDEVIKSRANTPTVRAIFSLGASAVEGVEDLLALSEKESNECQAADTARGDLALIGYTSGSTGDPKGCVSFHDDVLAIADGYARNVLRPTPEDRFGGHPSLAFTFGLGALLVFPFRFGSSTVLLEKFSPQAMLDTLVQDKVSIAFCAPTCYRMMIELDPEKKADLSALRAGVSAGETLPGAIFTRWKERGVELLDGLGSTELLHIFITSYPGEAKPGVTGRPAPGYEAKVVDEEGNEMPRGEPGLLAVRGPTTCRYWKKEERQRSYVKNGWSYPGDVFLQDQEGLFQYQCRNDDLIVTAGYNVAGIEVENVLLEHKGVREAGVVGVDDELRGKIIKAFIVLKPNHTASPQLEEELKEWVKGKLAPYKYPRQLEFVTALPRTDTGKVQRFRLRQP
jgi:2-aminobenzoate-CoA ligase